MLTITQPDITKSVAAGLRLAQDIPRQMRYAASRAINTALRAGHQAEQRRMAQVFDRPTPYTLRGGVSVQPSTKGQLSGSLSIATEPTGGNLPPGKPLLAEVRGGGRRAKRSEVLLQRAGVLPAGWLTVPGRGARLDAFGNLQRGQLLQILAYFRTYGATTRSGKRMRSNITDKGAARLRAGTRNRVGLEYFAVKPGSRGGLRPGIYARQVAGRRFVGPAAGVRAVLVFVPRVQYQARLDFVEQAQRAVAEALPPALTAAFRQALETAR